MTLDPLWVIVIFLLVWMLFLSIWVYNTSNHYRRLIGKTKREDLKEILNTLLNQQTHGEKKLQEVLVSIESFRKNNLANIQKIGVVKFNPYSGTGGAHSFALCILDGQDNGFIVLSLHGREDSRLYLKEVTLGKTEYELSKEEMQVFVKAKNNRLKQ